MKRTKVQCHDCAAEFTIKANEPPQFCCFCTEPILEKEKPVTDFDESEQQGEDPWDEYDEDLDEDLDEDEDEYR